MYIVFAVYIFFYVRIQVITKFGRPRNIACEKYRAYSEIRKQHPDWNAKQAYDELNRTFRYSDDFLKRAINEIHHAQYHGAWWGKKNPICITQASDGTIVISKNRGIIGKKSRERFTEIFGKESDKVIIVKGRGQNFNNSTLQITGVIHYNHAEARGVQALLNLGKSPFDATQATTLPSCDSCLSLQDFFNIINITG